METKICSKCNIEKIVTEFYFRSDTKKYKNACKDCIKKEKVIRESDPKIRERRARKEKERRAKDDGTINAKLREYRKTEKAKAIAKAWSKNNKDKIRNYNRTQRARRKFALKAELSASTAEVKSWLDAQTAICTYCETEMPKDKIHVDHMIPLSRGGTHTIDNLAIACNKCNCSKNNKTPEEFKAYKEAHKKLIEATDKKQ